MKSKLQLLTKNLFYSENKSTKKKLISVSISSDSIQYR